MVLLSSNSQSPPGPLSLFEQTEREQDEIFYRAPPAARPAFPPPHWHDIDHNHTSHIREHLYSMSTVILDDEHNIDTSTMHHPSPHGETIAGSFGGYCDRVTSVAFSPDGTQVVSGSWDRTVRVWNVKSGKVIAGPFEGHSYRVTSVAFSPDGTQVVSGSWDKTVRVWDVKSGKTIAGPFQGHSHWVTSVAFSPDGTQVVSGSWDKTVRVWDVESGKTIAGPFEGHSHWVTSVAFSPDGTQTSMNSQPPPLVDVEYNANSVCTSLEDPQACTFAGTHMFSHSREVSIHGGNFNNVAGDSFIISNGNNTIYQSYSQTTYSGLYSGRFPSTQEPPPSVESSALAQDPSSISASILFSRDYDSDEVRENIIFTTSMQIDVPNDHENEPTEGFLETEELLIEPTCPPELEGSGLTPDVGLKSIDTPYQEAVNTQSCLSNNKIHHILSLLPPPHKPILFRTLSFLMYSFDDLPLSSVASLLFPNDTSTLLKLLNIVEPIIPIPKGDGHLKFAHPLLRCFFGDRSCAGEFFVGYVKGHRTLLHCGTEYMKQLSWESGVVSVGSIDEKAFIYVSRYWERHEKSLNKAAKL